ncbi:ADP glucose pyrophosphorylase large subunit 1 [Prunus dulcis]|uniref:ADP glucose pyrophosphorylase large subunit 1 n=1 Tax=Prunus dulcis TaxID=3755 RepID=A0A4Y1REB1_PRUDU|nr:ADP glucose pyrophosphorylase large subunit 1 [Prunus dulcis]
MVKGLPLLQVPSRVCEECMVGKQHREPFPKESNWRATRILELVHSDICGPVNPISNSKKRYFITFTDDFSRKIWIYFLTEKSEALVVFKKFKASVEKETGVFIKALRTDRGGEFTSNDFVHFCEKNGIHRQLTAAYSPQQNGVVERKNRTIMNMVRSMLARTKVPKKFWPEAVNWSSHILNRCPTHAVKSVTPEEAWSSKKPQVNYFKVFGCLAYVHTPDNLRTKLDDKSTKCVMLGVSEESKAYRLYNPETQKIIISRDVVFDEANGWDWNNKQEKRAGVDLEEIETMNGVEEVTSREVEDEPVGHNSPRITEASPNLLRQRRPPGWMTDYVSGNELSDNENIAQIALTGGNDPTAFDDAVKSSKWRKAMDLEIQAIERNDTWELIDLPEGEKTVGVKWIFKTKFKENGEIDKYKARLVAKGYTQSMVLIIQKYLPLWFVMIPYAWLYP